MHKHPGLRGRDHHLKEGVRLDATPEQYSIVDSVRSVRPVPEVVSSAARPEYTVPRTVLSADIGIVPCYNHSTVPSAVPGTVRCAVRCAVPPTVAGVHLKPGMTHGLRIYLIVPHVSRVYEILYERYGSYHRCTEHVENPLSMDGCTEGGLAMNSVVFPILQTTT